MKFVFGCYLSNVFALKKSNLTTSSFLRQALGFMTVHIDGVCFHLHSQHFNGTSRHASSTAKVHSLTVQIEIPLSNSEVPS